MLVYLEKLLDSATSPKSCWSTLKTFLNNKKIRCILLLLHENLFFVDFKGKAKIFNTFSVKQRFLINTCSDLPPTLTKKPHKSMPTTCFISDDNLKIIKNLDPNKVHGYDKYSDGETL